MAEAADCFELENYVVKKVENYARFTLIIIRYFIFEFGYLKMILGPTKSILHSEFHFRRGGEVSLGSG